MLLAVLAAAALAWGAALAAGAWAGASVGAATDGAAGALTLALVRLGFDLTAALTVGWLCVGVLWLPPRHSGAATPAIRRACRAAGATAVGWAACSALLLINVWGQRAGGIALLGGLPQPSGPGMAAELGNLASAQTGYLISLGLAAMVALLSLGSGSEPARVVMLVAAVGALVPRAFIGNNADPWNRDYAIDATLLHTVSAAVWLGGLAAVLTILYRGLPASTYRTAPAHDDGTAAGPDAVMAALWRRYRSAATVAALVVAGSGLVLALVRLSGTSPLRSAYGRLLLLTVGLTVVAMAALLVVRKRFHGAPGSPPRSRAGSLRAGLVEVALLAVAFGASAALGVIVPPGPGHQLTAAQSILGFDLFGPPTLWKLLWYWRFDLLLGGGAVLAAVLYLRGVRMLARRGVHWSGKRTTAWLCGTGLLLLVTSSGLDRYALSQFSLHMILHMSIGMLVPILLVLGGPLTLALRVLPPAGRTGVPGLREALLRLLHSRVVRFVSHPGFAVPLFVGSFYAIYFTGLFGFLISTHGGHLAMNLHLLLVGYLYYWQVIGVDPAPRRYPALFRLGLLMAPIPFHSIFGLTVMNSRTLIAGDYYHSLGLPWMTNLLSDQKLGGAIAWALADIPTAIVVVSLVAQWFRNDEREARRIDRRFAAGRPDQELAAYNDMLAKLNQRDGSDPYQRGDPRG